MGGDGNIRHGASGFGGFGEGARDPPAWLSGFKSHSSFQCPGCLQIAQTPLKPELLRLRLWLRLESLPLVIFRPLDSLRLEC